MLARQAKALSVITADGCSFDVRVPGLTQQSNHVGEDGVVATYRSNACLELLQVPVGVLELNNGGTALLREMSRGTARIVLISSYTGPLQAAVVVRPGRQRRAAR